MAKGKTKEPRIVFHPEKFLEAYTLGDSKGNSETINRISLGIYQTEKHAQKAVDSTIESIINNFFLQERMCKHPENGNCYEVKGPNRYALLAGYVLRDMTVNTYEAFVGFSADEKLSMDIKEFLRDIR